MPSELERDMALINARREDLLAAAPQAGEGSFAMPTEAGQTINPLAINSNVARKRKPAADPHATLCVRGRTCKRRRTGKGE